uniref:hypothetical protein n=1 Tax=Nonomuraea rhizosphaerae TaxID=2665663 RepID=UPI001C5ECFE6
SARQRIGVELLGLRPFHRAHAETCARVRHALGARAYAAAFACGAQTGYSFEQGVRRPAESVPEAPSSPGAAQTQLKQYQEKASPGGFL